MNKENKIEQEHIVSLGEKLAISRQKLGLTESDIASKIHVRKTTILDIENNRIANIPTVFIKGYIKAYANIVRLPESEYQPYLDSLAANQPTQVMRNYSYKEQKKRKGKRLLLISLVIILVIIGITLFFIWKDDKNNLIEVTHYIYPPTSSIDS